MPFVEQPYPGRVQAMLEVLGRERLIGIVRLDSAEASIWAAGQLAEAGLKIIEIPYTVPDAPDVIEVLRRTYPEVTIGAGTVLEARDVLSALGAGAQFLVSPMLNEPMLQFGREQGILTLPGCTTPTEMYRAWSLGAAAVKFFPAGPAGGPAYLKAIREPLPFIPVIPTGGVTLEQIPQYLASGALAVGVGGPLLPADVVANRDADALQLQAKAFLQAAAI